MNVFRELEVTPSQRGIPIPTHHSRHRGHDLRHKQVMVDLLCVAGRQRNMDYGRFADVYDLKLGHSMSLTHLDHIYCVSVRGPSLIYPKFDFLCTACRDSIHVLSSYQRACHDCTVDYNLPGVSPLAFRLLYQTFSHKRYNM